MKNSQRLDFASLAEVLGQRSMVEPERLAAALQISAQGTATLPEVLVHDQLVAEWDLARVVCELYGLPFLPVEMYDPAGSAMEGLDGDFLRLNKLVPLDRHGQLLTVCMPILVPAEVLGLLAAQTNLNVIPVVGTVSGNTTWFESNVKESGAPNAPLPKKAAAQAEAAADDDWSEIFDAGDAAVHLELQDVDDDGALDDVLDGALEAEPLEDELPDQA